MSKIKQRTDFQIAEFSTIINQKGYDLLWEKALKCPCIPEEKTGQPDFNCLLCHGRGWYWFDPQDIKAVMTNFGENVRYNQAGEIAAGTAYLTTLPENKLGFWDRVTNLDSRIRHSEILTHGDHGGKDKLRFQPTDIVYCRSLSTEYIANKDFLFDPNAFELDWSLTGQEPESGDRYSVEYLMPPRWIVIDITNVIRDTFVKSKKAGITFLELPLRATVRLEYLVFNVIDPV
jgi:hypothetical protein